VTFGSDIEEPEGCPPRQELVDGFRAMVKALHERRGGVAVARIPVGKNPCGAVIVYALGATAFQNAKAADKVQAEFERMVRPSWFRKQLLRWQSRHYRLKGEVRHSPVGIRIQDPQGALGKPKH